MMAFATLTISLAKGNTPETHLAQYTFLSAKAEAKEEIFESAQIRLPVVPKPLDTAEKVAIYTRELSDAVFGNPSGSQALVAATFVATEGSVALRIRIKSDEDVPDVQDQHWELLADPRKEYAPLGWGERACLSRFMPSLGRQSFARAPGGRLLRAVALIATPADLSGASAVDLDAERSVVDESLPEARIRWLCTSAANLESLEQELQSGCDVLYLACHGRLGPAGPVFYFEDQARRARLVQVKQLADRMRAMQNPLPRLVVLASCESAGDALSSEPDANFFASAAVHLLKAGVPAVIGMQGRVGQAETRLFVTAFFRQLLAHGQVELATAAARAEIPLSGRWWLPAVLVSVESGKLWPEGPPRAFPNWEHVLTAIESGSAVPILGSEVVEQLSKRKAAAYLNPQLQHPQSGTRALELQNVAQQLMVEHDTEWPLQALGAFYRSVQRKDGINMPKTALVASLSAWSKVALSSPAWNPYAEIASWPVPLFVTANADDLLTDALAAVHEGTPPRVIISPWQDDTPSTRDDAPPRDLKLSKASPVVYHLFGHLGRIGEEPVEEVNEDVPPPKNAPVITEDDFFDHMIWVSQHSRAYIPASIPKFIGRSSLVFLGFRLDDWEFRVVLRNITKMPNVAMLASRLHVAVQLDPTELTADQQEAAIQSLEDYFRHTYLRLSIYWGTVKDFLRGLQRERRKREQELDSRDRARTVALGGRAAPSGSSREAIDFSRPIP